MHDVESRDARSSARLLGSKEGQGASVRESLVLLVLDLGMRNCLVNVAEIPHVDMYLYVESFSYVLLDIYSMYMYACM